MLQLLQQRFVFRLYIPEPFLLAGHLPKTIHNLFTAGSVVKVLFIQPTHEIPVKLVRYCKGTYRGNTVMPIPEFSSVVKMIEIVHDRSEEHTSELQSLMRISYAVFCLKNKTLKLLQNHNTERN